MWTITVGIWCDVVLFLSYSYLSRLSRNLDLALVLLDDSCQTPTDPCAGCIGRSPIVGLPFCPVTHQLSRRTLDGQNALVKCEHETTSLP